MIPVLFDKPQLISFVTFSVITNSPTSLVVTALRRDSLKQAIVAHLQSTGLQFMKDREGYSQNSVHPCVGDVFMYSNSEKVNIVLITKVLF